MEKKIYKELANDLIVGKFQPKMMNILLYDTNLFNKDQDFLKPISLEAEYLTKTIIDNFEIHKLVTFYINYLFRFIRKHSRKNIENSRMEELAKLLFKFTIPKITEKIVDNIKKESKFHLIKSKGKMLITFEASVKKINQELFYKHNIKTFELLNLGTFSDLKTIEVKPSINDFLANIFNEYEMIISTFNNQLQHAKRLLVKMQSIKNMENKILITKMYELNREKQESEYVDRMNRKRGDNEPSKKTTPSGGKPGIESRYKTKQDLELAIKSVDNYQDLSMRKMASLLKYKSDSGYTNRLKSFNLPLDYHKKLK